MLRLKFIIVIHFKMPTFVGILKLTTRTSNSYSMACLLTVRGDNSRVLASGLSYVQVDKPGKTILYHLHQCIPC